MYIEYIITTGCQYLTMDYTQVFFIQKGNLLLYWKLTVKLYAYTFRIRLSLKSWRIQFLYVSLWLDITTIINKQYLIRRRILCTVLISHNILKYENVKVLGYVRHNVQHLTKHKNFLKTTFVRSSSTEHQFCLLCPKWVLVVTTTPLTQRMYTQDVYTSY